MNDLQIITGGAGDDEVKVYTGRADSRARSGGEFPSGDPDFQREEAARAAARRAYREYIEGKRKEWIGKKVMYEGEIYTVADVDYNGSLMIDKKARFTETTAVSESMVRAIK